MMAVFGSFWVVMGWPPNGFEVAGCGEMEAEMGKRKEQRKERCFEKELRRLVSIV